MTSSHDGQGWSVGHPRTTYGSKLIHIAHSFLHETSSKDHEVVQIDTKELTVFFEAHRVMLVQNSGCGIWSCNGEDDEG